MSITAERLMVEVQADVRQALYKLSAVEKQAASSTGRMSKMAKSMGLAFTGAAVVGGITKTIGLAMTFDKTMRQVGVQTDQSGKKLERLGTLAKRMGADTVFSAQDAGQAMLELAKGGLSAADMRAGALKQTLTLASAGGLDLANAAGYITQGMNTFGIGAKKAGQIVTALAGGANASTASVESLGMALSQVGPGAVNAGLSIQETVAALAAFDNNGIKGSDAGTSLKTMLTRLVPSTKRAKEAMKDVGLWTAKTGNAFLDAHGNFRSLESISGSLRKSLKGLSDEQRTQALNSIFGSDATRAATVLMKEGKKGIEGYLKATKDQKKAQEMANATMKGASGAWENFKGSVETAAISLGQKALPGVTKFLNMGADMVNKVMAWGPQMQDTFGWVVPTFQGLASAVKPVVELAKLLASAWGALPGPMKTLAIQVGLAALAFPKLSSAATSVGGSFTTMSAKVKQLGAEMTYTETRAQRLGQAAKAAAGVGGMVLLAQGAERAGTKLGALETTMGGALTGFAVGGPIGAAVGGGIGLLKSWNDAVDNSGWVAKQAAKVNADYAASFDQVTGAMTKATRATVYSNLQKNDGLTASRMIGIPDRDMINATMGDVEAMARIKKKVDALTGTQKQLTGKHADQFFFNKQAASDFINALKMGGKALTNEQKAFIKNLEAQKTWREALKGVPKVVQTRLKAMDYDLTLKQIERLHDRYDMTPKQVKTTLKALGVDVTKAQLQAILDKAKDVDKVKPEVHVGAKDDASGPLDRVKGKANDVGRLKPQVVIRAQDAATGIISKIKSALSLINGTTATTYVRTVRTGSRGPQLGVATGGRVVGPGTGTSDSIPARLSNGEYVMDAETTKRALPLLEAIHRNKGRVLGFASGGPVGDSKAKAKAVWGADTVGGIVSAVKESAKSMHQVMDRLRKVIEKNMAGSQQAHWMKELRDRERRMSALWKRQEAVQARLAAAQEKLSNVREAKSSFVESAKSGMASQATVLNAGNSASAIAHSLTVQVDKVKRFAKMLTQLRKMGYPDSIVRQIAEAGVEGGYSAAESLLAASKSDQRTISSAFTTIQSVAGDTSKQLGSQMYDSGIKAAQGLVKGLKDRQKDVERTIMAMAMAMQKALKKALGIHSPSRAFYAITRWAPKGMVKALSDGQREVADASARLGMASIGGAKWGGRRVTPDQLNGGLRAGSSVTFIFHTHNPQPEPQSRTTNRALAKVASLSLV